MVFGVTTCICWLFTYYKAKRLGLTFDNPDNENGHVGVSTADPETVGSYKKFTEEDIKK